MKEETTGCHIPEDSSLHHCENLKSHLFGRLSFCVFTLGVTHHAIRITIADIRTITIFVIIFEIFYYKDNAEHPSRVVSNPTSYSVGLGLKSQPRNPLTWLWLFLFVKSLSRPEKGLMYVTSTHFQNLSDSVFTSHPKTRHCIYRASEIVVKLTVNTNVGVWEKLIFHPLDCFTGGCCGKRTQKNSLGEQISALVANRLFQMC
jgi:hypothetical protein